MRRVMAIAVVCGIFMLGGCSKKSTNSNNSGDTTNPVVVFVSPLNGGTLGLVSDTLRVIATDNVGVTGVQFYDGTTLIGAAAAGANNTYFLVWNPTAAGAHTLKAVASDAAGNTGQASISISVTGGPTLHSGNISHSETWYPTGNPHRITGDVYVEDAVNSPILTIMPGCIVEFTGDFELYCGYNNPGAIVAEGKTDTMITFTTTSNPKTPGSWRSVSAYSRSTSATSFKYCVFEYGGSSSQGELYISDVATKINNCTVRYSQNSGIKFDGDNGRPTQFANNTINNCGTHAIVIAADYVRLLGVGNSFSANTNNDIFVSGNVKTTGTWLNQGIPYLLTNSVAVEDAANSPVLTIAAGTTIIMGSGVEFYTGYSHPGGIIANGTALAPIVFTTNANPPSPGGWRAVQVYSNATTAVFNYCTFSYGGANGDDGMLHIDGTQATVTNCTIQGSEHHGIRLWSNGRFTQFTGNTVSNCLGHAIELGPDQVRTLGSGNTYTGNTNNDILVDGGSVTTTCTWLNQGIPFAIRNDIAVEDASNSPVLTIAPHTVVKMQSSVEFYVGYSHPGGLIADTVTFTSASLFPSSGDWKALTFYDLSMDAASRLRHCVVEYAGGLDANVKIDNSNPAITDCTIQHSSKWGIYLSGSTHPDQATLEANNTFSANASGNVGP